MADKERDDSRDKTYKVKLDGKSQMRIYLSKKANIETGLSSAGPPVDESPVMPTQDTRAKIIPKKKKKNVMRFFDLGLYSNGDDNYVNFSNPLNPGYGQFLAYATVPIPTSDYNDLTGTLESRVISENPNDLGTVFTKIDKGDRKYDRFISRIFPNSTSMNLDELDEWEDRGLVYDSLLEDDSKLNFFASFHFAIVPLTSDPELRVRFKITNGSTFESDSVDFEFLGELDIFIMPEIIHHFSTIDYHFGLKTVGSVSDVRKRYDIVSSNYSTVPRERLVTIADLFYNTSISYYEFSYLFAKEIIKFPDMRGMSGERIFYTNPPHDYYNTYTPIDPNTYPNSVVFSPTSARSDFPYDAQGGVGVNFGYSNEPGTKRLSFIIKKGGQYFYFWDITVL